MPTDHFQSKATFRVPLGGGVSPEAPGARAKSRGGTPASFSWIILSPASQSSAIDLPATHPAATNLMASAHVTWGRSALWWRRLWGGLRCVVAA